MTDSDLSLSLEQSNLSEDEHLELNLDSEKSLDGESSYTFPTGNNSEIDSTEDDLSVSKYKVIIKSYITSYNKIEPYDLWIGDAKSGLDENFILNEKITVIIDVGSFNNIKFDNKNPYADTITYKRINILDRPYEKIIIHFDELISLIEKSLDNKQKVLVHCQAGISRSASIVIAYIMYKKDINHKDALKYVRKYRKIVNPNHGFVEQLEYFEKYIKPLSFRLKKNGVSYKDKLLNGINTIQ